jgi:hypothetical protein
VPRLRKQALEFKTALELDRNVLKVKTALQMLRSLRAAADAATAAASCKDPGAFWAVLKAAADAAAQASAVSAPQSSATPTHHRRGACRGQSRCHWQ